jgi:threonine dehydrogenase-like Zn-dependent dehydrogenase
LIRSFGPSYISAKDAPLDSVSDVTGSFDLIFEAIGTPVAFNALHALAHNGIFVLTGIPAVRPPELMQGSRFMRDMVLKNQVILGTVNAGRDAHEGAIHQLAQFMTLFPDAVRSLITGRLPLDKWPAALERGADDIKIVIDMEASA